MESSLPTIFLKPGEADRIVAGHPWVYHGSVLRMTAQAGDGEMVQVKDHRMRLLGVGFYNSKSKINVRVLAPERIEVDQNFFDERIAAALAVRKRYLPKATSFRVVNAESDFLTGLIIDKYEDVIVIQISALGMEKRKDKFEGLAEANGLIAGKLDGPVSVNLNGIKFETDILGGHKTGMYLDQQTSYEAVAQFAKGAMVLDCFSFLGGFGLHAARAGAEKVIMLDQSADAVAAS